MKRIAITGIGAVTPLDNSFTGSWNSIKSGISGIRHSTKVLFRNEKTYPAGEINNLQTGRYLTAKELNYADLFSIYAVAAALEAFESSGLAKGCRNELERAGIIVGSSRGGITTLERECRKGSATRLSPHLMPVTTVNAAAFHIAASLGLGGHCLGISNACSSGTNAIGEAFRMIRSGLASIVIAGGSEAPLCRLCFKGYASAGALSDSPPDCASRPFDRDRDGFVLAEGACMLVLEEMQLALARQAEIYGEIIGYANICDALHLTKPSAAGEIRAIEGVLADAGISAGDVDYINAHGTSTPLGDKAEACAISGVFGNYRVPVSSIKSMTGHMLAASGAFEVACSAMSLREGCIPPTINTCHVDPECGINLVTAPTPATIETAIINSFGFGGVNSAVAIKKA